MSSESIRYPNSDLNHADTYLSYFEESIHRQTLVTEFVSTVFHIPTQDVDQELAIDPESFQTIKDAITHLSFHAITTLYPDERSYPPKTDLSYYRREVNISRHQLELLDRKYIQGKSMNEISAIKKEKNEEGASLSALSRVHGHGIDLLRDLILKGNHRPGIMGGIPIDNLRRLSLKFLDEDAPSSTHISLALDHSSNIRKFEYQNEQLSIRDLPISARIKEILTYNDIKILRDMPENLLDIGIKAPSAVQIDFVLGVFTELRRKGTFPLC